MYKKIASNTIFQILSKVLTAIISIFLIGILTKYLPIEMYGSYNKVYSYLGIFAFLADLGLYTIAVREISRKGSDPEKIIGNILTLRIGLAVCIWVLAFLIAFLLPGYNDTLTLIAIFIVGGFTLISLINSSLLALMQSQMKIEFSLISVVSGKLINIALIAIFLMYIFTDVSQISLAYTSVFIAGFIGILLNTYMNYIYAKKIIPIRLLCDTQYIKHIFKVSLPYGIALFLSVVYFKIDIILLSLLENPEKADISIALYGLPMKIIEVLMVLGGFYLNSLLPSLSKSFSENKHEKISDMLGISLKVLISFALLIFTLGNLFAVEVISIIATQQYVDPAGHMYNSVQALSLCLGVLVFHFISLAFIYIFIASERQGILLWINAGVTVVNIVGNILLIPHYSFLGAAIVTLVSQILLMIICSSIIVREIKISLIYIRGICMSFIIAGILFYLSSIVKDTLVLGNIWSIVIISPIFVISYILLEYVVSKNIIEKISLSR